MGRMKGLVLFTCPTCKQEIVEAIPSATVRCPKCLKWVRLPKGARRR